MNLTKSLKLLRISRKELAAVTGAPLGSCACWVSGDRSVPENHKKAVQKLVKERYLELSKAMGAA